LRRLPKAELHCHLDGSVRPATLLELASEYGVEMPAADATSLATHMRVPDGSTLEQYLTRFTTTLSVMQTTASLERITLELAEDAAAENVRYLEIRYSPVLNVLAGLSLADAVDAPLRAIARAERETGIVCRLIICALRHLSPEVSLELARLAVSYRKQGVVGFDLAGGEAGNPAAEHVEAFTYAREHDMACTVHAGEAAGAQSVRQAIHICGADRIGHGTRLIEDHSLTEYVNDRRIPIEICLTSNVQTGAAASWKAHPLRQYFDRGLRVALATDNRLMSGTTLTDEYARAAEEYDFTLPEICTIARNGFEGAFLPWDERRALLERVDAEFLSLQREA
jgi:adenosine deaminase